MEIIQINTKPFKLHINNELAVIFAIGAASLLFPYLVWRVDFPAARIDVRILSGKQRAFFAFPQFDDN